MKPDKQANVKALKIQGYGSMQYFTNVRNAQLTTKRTCVCVCVCVCVTYVCVCVCVCVYVLVRTRTCV